MDRFSEVGDNRRRKIESNFELARETGWTFKDISELTIFEKSVIIRHLNKQRREAKRKMRKR